MGVKDFFHVACSNKILIWNFRTNALLISSTCVGKRKYHEKKISNIPNDALYNENVHFMYGHIHVDLKLKHPCYLFCNSLWSTVIRRFFIGDALYFF